jgi:uncharacterized membrane protein
MDMVAVTVGIGWVVAGLVCFGLAIPLARGKVPRNKLYGARFPESLQSDRAWDAINRFGGKRMIPWSLLLIAIGVTAMFLPLQPHPRATLFIGFAPLIVVFIPVLETWRFARRFGREAQ